MCGEGALLGAVLMVGDLDPHEIWFAGLPSDPPANSIAHNKAPATAFAHLAIVQGIATALVLCS